MLSTSAAVNRGGALVVDVIVVVAVVVFFVAVVAAVVEVVEVDVDVAKRGATPSPLSTSESEMSVAAGCMFAMMPRNACEMSRD